MLKYIFDELKSEFAVPIGDLPEERVLWLSRVNRAAKLLYNKGDFEGLSDEEVLDFAIGEQQVSIPSYMGHIRGMRYYDNRQRAPLAHPQNRYGMGVGNETWYLKDYREKSRSPLSEGITNISTLTFTIPEIEVDDIVLYLRGQTQNSYRFAETLTIPAGSLSVESVGNYSKLESLRKNRLTTYNITVTDAEDNEMAVVPNSQYESLYRIIQILDTENVNTAGTSDLAIEVFYKKTFIPFVNDEDEFVGGSQFDDAIIFKILELRASTTEETIKWSVQCKEALKDLYEDSTPGKRRQLGFTKHPAIGMQYGNY